MRLPALVLACVLGFVGLAPEAYAPARYRAGTVPGLPAMVVGGGQVILELAIDRGGRVTAVTTLRTTLPFTDLVAGAVRDWQFVPAEGPRRPARAGERPSQAAVPSKVLVAAVFRPPAMNAPTLGEPRRDVAPASDESAFPLNIALPPFPPSAAAGGVVLLEARVGRSGDVDETTVIQSAPPFDDVALATLKKWSFRPARVRGRPVSTFAYVLFGFPAPVGLAGRTSCAASSGLSNLSPHFPLLPTSSRSTPRAWRGQR